MATELAISTEKMQKFVDDLEAEKTILSTCAQLFTTLSNHFKSMEDSLSLRSKSVESKLQSLESASRQTLESLSAREGSIALRESEAVECVQQRKQAAIAEIEKPVPRDAGLGEALRSLAMRMDSMGLMKFIIFKRKEPALFRADLSDAINEAIDPPRLVLDAVEHFLTYKSLPAIMDRRWAVGMLVNALFPDLKSDSNANSAEENVEDLAPRFAKNVGERALRVLENWKGQIETTEEGTIFGRFGPVEAVIFLQMVVGFGLKSRFDEAFLKKLVVEFSSRRDIAKVAPRLGFGEELADIIDELVKNGKEIDAVYFATESGLTERFPPVSLLKSFLKTSKKNAMDALKRGNNSAAASEESSNIELNAIKAVVKCVEDQKLESVFTLDVLKKRANVLEKAKAERKKTPASTPSSSSKSAGKRGNHSSGGGGKSSRPAKVAKTSYNHPSPSPYGQRSNPGGFDVGQNPRQPSPATARYHHHPHSAQYNNNTSYAAAGNEAYDVYTPSSFGGANSSNIRNPPGVIPAPQYSPIIDSSVAAMAAVAAAQAAAAAYNPAASALLGEQTSYPAYDYSVAAQQAYQPANPSYT